MEGKKNLTFYNDEAGMSPPLIKGTLPEQAPLDVT